MKTFLGQLSLVNGTKYRVGRTFPNPPADYEQTDGIGVTVDSMPIPQIPENGHVNETFVDIKTKEVTYTYAVNVGGKEYDPSDLNSVKDYKISKINQIAGEKIDGGFYSYAEGQTDSKGKPKMLLYKSDANHREQLGLLYNLVQFHSQGLFADTKCRWKDASLEDQPCHEITDACATQLFAEMGQHLLWCKLASDALVQQITASETIEAVNAIAWPYEPVPVAPATGAAT